MLAGQDEIAYLKNYRQKKCILRLYINKYQCHNVTIFLWNLKTIIQIQITNKASYLNKASSLNKASYLNKTKITRLFHSTITLYPEHQMANHVQKTNILREHHSASITETTQYCRQAGSTSPPDIEIYPNEQTDRICRTRKDSN
jgi:hypothetical protein